jgi:hypothetical protein
LRIGVLRALLFCGVLQMLANLMYIVQAWAGHDLPVLALTIGVENLTGAMGSAAFVAYLSGLCNLAFTATQYALLTSLAAIGRTTLSASGGAIADAVGWSPFFLYRNPRLPAGSRHARLDHRTEGAGSASRDDGRSCSQKGCPRSPREQMIGATSTL